MENKYIVLGEDLITKECRIYTILNLENHEEYSCTIDESEKEIKISVDEKANLFDIGEALFQYELEMHDILPSYMISFDMEKAYEDYYPGKGRCDFKTEEEYKKAYKEEQNRVKNYKKKEKQYIKGRLYGKNQI